MPFEREIEHWRALPQLSVKETAAVLGVGVDSVRALLKAENNGLEGRHICGKTFVIVRSLRRLMDEEIKQTATLQRRQLDRSELKAVRELREGVVS